MTSHRKTYTNDFPCLWCAWHTTFLVWSLIDRSIELASNLVPFKGLLSLFIYFVALRKGFHLNRCNDRLGLNMPGACSSSLRCHMVCVTRSTTPSHHSLSIIYTHYLQMCSFFISNHSNHVSNFQNKLAWDTKTNTTIIIGFTKLINLIC